MISFNPLLRPIQLPWLNALSIRTLQRDAFIMSIQVGQNDTAVLRVCHSFYFLFFIFKNVYVLIIFINNIKVCKLYFLSFFGTISVITYFFPIYVFPYYMNFTLDTNLQSIHMFRNNFVISFINRLYMVHLFLRSTQ